ncbi:YdcF family protein [archaeon]|nr:YdcF family protein [archaeon]MBT4022352.1 YdcF family protein [archaeon]MBT4273230.1 YdcF family protein [archaeon]MBT4461327.1 YdcF family protein [archaeon]MBT4858994.1 YdcF family protein [archaeon]
MAPSPSIQINKNLDAILILAGEYKSGRSELTHQIYTQIMETGRDENPLFVVVSGKKSGFNGTESKVSESAQIRDYLIRLGVAPEHLIVEEESLDTFGNIVYSFNKLQAIDATSVGLITDHFHMNRAQTITERVYGDRINVEFIPTETTASKLVNWRDRAYLTTFNFLTRNIESGDVEGFKNFLEKNHPFYTKNPSIGYKIGKHLVKLANKAISLTQKDSTYERPD